MHRMNTGKKCKLVLTLLIIALLLFISGCVGYPKETTTLPPPNTPPKAAASASPSYIYEGDAVTFNGLTSTDSDGSIVSYQWNFGDGETGTGATLSHKYSKAGTYTALLTVVDNGGLKDTDSIKIIANPKPTPTSTIQTTADSKKVVKLIDFIPRKGETIAGLSLKYELIGSGSDKIDGIDYYPEDVVVWSNDIAIFGKRFLNSEDAKKNFYSFYKSDTISFGDWNGSTVQRDVFAIGGKNYEGMWEIITVKKEEYILDVAINGVNVPYAREKAEIVVKILIDRYNAALW